MSIEKVKTYFREFGMENRIIEFPTSSATVELAAKALDCEPCRIAKTLSFGIDGKAILIVAAGDAKVDNKNTKLVSAPKPECSLPKKSTTLSVIL